MLSRPRCASGIGLRVRHAPPPSCRSRGMQQWSGLRARNRAPAPGPRPVAKRSLLPGAGRQRTTTPRFRPPFFRTCPIAPPGLRHRSARARCTRCEVHHSGERCRPSKRIDRYHRKNRFRRCGGKKQPRWPKTAQVAPQTRWPIAGGQDGQFPCLRCGLGWRWVPMQARSASEGRYPCRRAGG